jgi:fumarate hydratase class II
MPHDRGVKGGSPTSARIETDALGPIEVAHDTYWGAQTERSRRNFRIGDDIMPKSLIRAIAMAKKAAAYLRLIFR